MDFHPADRDLLVLPMFHIGGIGLFTLPMIYVGGTVVIQRTFDAGGNAAASAGGEDHPLFRRPGHLSCF